MLNLIALGVLIFVLYLAAVWTAFDKLFTNRPRTKLLYLIHLRYHVLFFFLLFGLPLVIWSILPASLRSLSNFGLFGLITSATLIIVLATALITTGIITAGYGGLRFDLEQLSVRQIRRHLVAKAALPSVLTVLLLVTSAPALWRINSLAQPRLGPAMTGAAWGVEFLVLIFLAVCSAFLAAEVIRSATEEHESGHAAERIFAGFKGRDGHLLPGHRLAISLLALFGLLLVVVWFAFSPENAPTGCLSRTNGTYCLPVLSYVLLLILPAIMLLTLITFTLDRWRFEPLLAIAIVVSVLLIRSGMADHRFEIIDANTALAVPSVAEAVDAWANQGPKDVPETASAKPMVVVATSGGGVRAAAWTACVLSQLEASLGTKFTDSLFAISSVSGGSLGSLYYLSSFDRDTFDSKDGTTRSADHLGLIADAAAGPSLSALAYAIVFVDTPALFLGRSGTHNRGSALDRLWGMRRSLLVEHRRNIDLMLDEEVSAADTTLREYAALVGEGRAPIPLFNSTIVERGEVMSFAPIRFGDVSAAGDTDSVHGFFDVFEDFDLKLTTATRLSATFPYVAPIARADLQDERGQMHFADGGYFDNFGMTSLERLLEEALPEYEATGTDQRVVLITIRNSGQSEAMEERRIPSIVYALAGPLLTVAQVRTRQQDLMFKRAHVDLADKVSEAGIVFDRVDFHLDEDVPLSWDLLPSEVGLIDKEWNDEATQVEVGRLAKLIRAPARNVGAYSTCSGK